MHEIPRLLILLTHRMYVCFTQQEITTHPWFQNLLTGDVLAHICTKIAFCAISVITPQYVFNYILFTLRPINISHVYVAGHR